MLNMAQLPEYKLQILFNMRERSKKDAEDAYAKEQKKVATAENKLKTMQKTLEEMKATRDQKRVEYANAMQKERMTIEKIEINNRHLEMLVEKENTYEIEINKQVAVVEQAKKVAKEALDKMLKATQEFKALEKHRENWLKEVKVEIEKKENDAGDEISQAQYFSRTKE
jgi:YscO-like protein